MARSLCRSSWTDQRWTAIFLCSSSVHHCFMILNGDTVIPSNIPRYSNICKSATSIISVTMSTWKIVHGVKIGFHSPLFWNIYTLISHFSLKYIPLMLYKQYAKKSNLERAGPDNWSSGPSSNHNVRFVKEKFPEFAERHYLPLNLRQKMDEVVIHQSC